MSIVERMCYKCIAKPNQLGSITSPNTVNGENNVVDSGDNSIKNNNSGHTLETNDNTVSIGGAFKSVRNFFG